MGCNRQFWDSEKAKIFLRTIEKTVLSGLRREELFCYTAGCDMRGIECALVLRRAAA